VHEALQVEKNLLEDLQRLCETANKWYVYETSYTGASSWLM
jgi:hypothetical protein